MVKFSVVLFFQLTLLHANLSYDLPQLTSVEFAGQGYLYPYPEVCFEILKAFADSASNFTLCSIINARPIRLCENCVKHYVKFHDTYKELLNTAVNGTSCGSIFMSQDRLNVIQRHHDGMLGIWDKGNCNDCFIWSNETATLKNSTTKFYEKFNDTMQCIVSNINTDEKIVCEKCMQKYVELDEFYKTLSKDKIGVDSVCMDIVDSMNRTRSIWSKTLSCCNLRRSPEVVFLCCTGIISFLPILFYIALRYCAPIKDLPNVLKQSRFKQSLMRSIDSRRSS
ncbi:unnamed protein product [Colias eurytheme]|nr:unnamed protein product [Colias eurytheme]